MGSAICDPFFNLVIKNIKTNSLSSVDEALYVQVKKSGGKM